MHLFFYYCTVVDYSAARRYALFLLSKKHYHSSLLLQKLIGKGAKKKIAEKVLKDCQKMGLLDDKQALYFLLQRGHSPKLIAWRLKIPLEQIYASIDSEALREKVRKSLSKFSSKQKAFSSLLRKGFDYELISEEWERLVRDGI